MTRHLFLALLCCCSTAIAQTVYKATVLDASSAPLPDAVVYLTPAVPPAAPAVAPTEPVIIAQDGQEYVPYVTAVLVGTTAVFPNRDAVQHHIYSVSPSKRFEKPLYSSGSSESIVFDKPGVVNLGCNIHDWMSAYVIVLATPHFARTDKDGRAEISGLAPGVYRAEVWHPRLRKPVTKDITLASNTKADSITIELRAERRIRRAPTWDNRLY